MSCEELDEIICKRISKVLPNYSLEEIKHKWENDTEELMEEFVGQKYKPLDDKFRKMIENARRC